MRECLRRYGALRRHDDLVSRNCFTQKEVQKFIYLRSNNGFRYKSTPAVLFWQWANQSFNALVNYTNRNAKSELSTQVSLPFLINKSQDLVVAYGSAVTGALSLSIGLKSYFAKRQVSGALQRMVPFGAVAVANAINIPLMRQK